MVRNHLHRYDIMQSGHPQYTPLSLCASKLMFWYDDKGRVR